MASQKQNRALANWLTEREQDQVAQASEARIEQAQRVAAPSALLGPAVEPPQTEGGGESPPPSPTPSTREEIVDHLWPLALAAAERTLTDPSSPESARVAAMKVVWEAKVGKEAPRAAQVVVYECAVYAFADG